MKELKKIWDSVPMTVKRIALVFVIYKVFVLAKDFFAKIQLQADLNNDESNYDNSSQTTTYNTYSNVKKLYSVFYDDLTENEDIAKTILHNCPSSARRQFRSMYGQYLIDTRDEWEADHWLTGWARHRGKDLQSDCLYFLGNDYSDVEYFFN